MTAAAASDGHDVAAASERRWAIIVMVIIALLVLMMIVTGLKWAAMPPSRVETIDPRTLHIAGEFVESNLGTTVNTDGRVVARIVAQQYSFEPQSSSPQTSVRAMASAEASGCGAVASVGFDVPSTGVAVGVSGRAAASLGPAVDEQPTVATNMPASPPTRAVINRQRSHRASFMSRGLLSCSRVGGANHGPRARARARTRFRAWIARPRAGRDVR